MQNVYLKNSNDQVVYPVRDYGNYPDAECVAAFVDYMNSKATSLSMTNTHYYDPMGLAPAGSAGANIENKGTVTDQIKMLLKANAFNELCEMWNKPSYTIYVKGENARSFALTSTVKGNQYSNVLDNAYHIFGGKTGWSNHSQGALVVVVSDNNGGMWLVSILGASNHDRRFNAAKEACDIAAELAEDPDYIIPDNPVPDADCAMVCQLPIGNPATFDGYSLTAIYSKGATTVKHLASTSKVMNIMCALDFVQDINECFEIHAGDLHGGTGEGMFQAGDFISFKDAMYAMMLPSANTAAYALAREVGKRILYHNNELA